MDVVNFTHCTCAVRRSGPRDFGAQLAAGSSGAGSFTLKSVEASDVINGCRCIPMSELPFLTNLTGGSLGYGSMDTVTINLCVADHTYIKCMTVVILAQPGGTNTVKHGT
jgi:hypothetical protein